MKILITGAKTATALKLSKAFNRDEILLGDYGDLPSISTNVYTFVSLGYWNSAILAHNLLTKCLDYGVDLLLPLYESEITALSKSLVLFEEFGLKVLVPQIVPEQKSSSKDWAIFSNGDLIFGTNESVVSPLLTDDLNGAYYLNEEGKPIASIIIIDPSNT